MKIKEDYTVDYKIGNYDYGEITVPKGTKVTHMTALGNDPNYHFVDDFSWYRPDLTGFARKMALHDFVHYGINVPKEFIEE